MTARQPTTQTINVTEARQTWSRLINRVFRSRDRVIIEKSGIPVAALISAEELERFTRLEQDRASDFSILDEIGEAFKHESPEESEQRATRAVAEAREAHRRQQVIPEA